MANQSTQSAELRPKAGRPIMPTSYGIARGDEGLIAWEWASKRIEASYNYWICTASPGGKPHAMPVWGVWVEGTLIFCTGRESRKARNLAQNPQLVVHLESGDDAVILEGTVEEIAEPALLTLADAAYAAKYVDPMAGTAFHIPPTPDGAGPVYGLRPRVVLAWRESNFPTSATRWTFAVT